MRINKSDFKSSKSKINMANLKELRLKKGYSQVKLQHLVGVSSSSIEAYEQGVRIPSLPVIYKLSEVLDCSIDCLVGKEKEIDKYYSLTEEDKEKVIKEINELLKNRY